MSEKVVEGAWVSLEFTLTLAADGSEVESSREDGAFTFVVGDGTLAPCLEAPLLGMKAKEHAVFELDAGEAFGPHDLDNIHWLAKDAFPEAAAPKPGLVIEFTNPEGESVPGFVQQVDEDGVMVDFNHPLAGHDLRFEVTILSIESPSAEDVQ